LSDKAVALVVKRCAEHAGLDPALFSGHCLRAALATSVAAHRLEERDIQRQTRHRNVTVLRRYIRDGDLFHANGSGRVGL
jgi:integrase